MNEKGCSVIFAQRHRLVLCAFGLPQHWQTHGAEADASVRSAVFHRLLLQPFLCSELWNVWSITPGGMRVHRQTKQKFRTRFRPRRRVDGVEKVRKCAAAPASGRARNKDIHHPLSGRTWITGALPVRRVDRPRQYRCFRHPWLSTGHFYDNFFSRSPRWQKNFPDRRQCDRVREFHRPVSAS